MKNTERVNTGTDWALGDPSARAQQLQMRKSVGPGWKWEVG